MSLIHWWIIAINLNFFGLLYKVVHCAVVAEES